MSLRVREKEGGEARVWPLKALAWCAGRVQWTVVRSRNERYLAGGKWAPIRDVYEWQIKSSHRDSDSMRCS